MTVPILGGTEMAWIAFIGIMLILIGIKMTKAFAK